MGLPFKLQIFFHDKPEQQFIGKYNSVQALCFDCPYKIFHTGIHRRSERLLFQPPASPPNNKCCFLMEKMVQLPGDKQIIPYLIPSE